MLPANISSDSTLWSVMGSGVSDGSLVICTLTKTSKVTLMDICSLWAKGKVESIQIGTRVAGLLESRAYRRIYVVWIPAGVPAAGKT